MPARVGWDAPETSLLIRVPPCPAARRWRPKRCACASSWCASCGPAWPSRRAPPCRWDPAERLRGTGAMWPWACQQSQLDHACLLSRTSDAELNARLPALPLALQPLVRPLYDCVMQRLSAQVGGVWREDGRGWGAGAPREGDGWGGAGACLRCRTHACSPRTCRQAPPALSPSPRPAGPGPGGEGVRHQLHGRRGGGPGRRAGRRRRAGGHAPCTYVFIFCKFGGFVWPVEQPQGGKAPWAHGRRAAGRLSRLKQHGMAARLTAAAQPRRLPRPGGRAGRGVCRHAAARGGARQEARQKRAHPRLAAGGGCSRQRPRGGQPLPPPARAAPRCAPLTPRLPLLLPAVSQQAEASPIALIHGHLSQLPPSTEPKHSAGPPQAI